MPDPAQIRKACELILRDEARHIQFGRILMKRFFEDLSEEEKVMLGEKFSKKLRGSLLNGVYAVVNLPKEERKRAAHARTLAADYGLGATHPDEEVDIIVGALQEIREDVALLMACRSRRYRKSRATPRTPPEADMGRSPYAAVA